MKITVIYRNTTGHPQPSTYHSIDDIEYRGMVDGSFFVIVKKEKGRIVETIYHPSEIIDKVIVG